VAWEVIEPVEGNFYFTRDSGIQDVRDYGFHLVPLSFRAFKNGKTAADKQGGYLLKIKDRHVETRPALGQDESHKISLMMLPPVATNLE
jgi:hypothetical protein